MNRKTYDEIFDAKLKAAGHMLLDKLAEEAPSEQEICELGLPDSRLDTRIRALVRRASARHAARKLARASVFVAAALVMIVGVGIITIKHTQALPVKFKDIKLFESEDYVSLSAVEGIQTQEDFLTDDADFIRPRYLPEGFELVGVNISTSSIKNSYLGAENESITIYKSEAAGSIGFDSEHGNHYKTQIMGNEAVVYESGGTCTVYYFSNNYYYEITGWGVGDEELIKIAEKLPS